MRWRAGGHKFLRGGAFKPRTSPYDFQGLEEEGLKLLRKAKQETGLGIITEVMSDRDVDWSPNMPTYCRSARAICRTSPAEDSRQVRPCRSC